MSPSMPSFGGERGSAAKIGRPRRRPIRGGRYSRRCSSGLEDNAGLAAMTTDGDCPTRSVVRWRHDHPVRRHAMTVCPIAIAVGCKKCPAFAVCPLKNVIGDYRKEDDVKAAPAPKGKAGKASK